MLRGRYRLGHAVILLTIIYFFLGSELVQAKSTYVVNIEIVKMSNCPSGYGPDFLDGNKGCFNPSQKIAFNLVEGQKVKLAIMSHGSIKKGLGSGYHLFDVIAVNPPDALGTYEKSSFMDRVLQNVNGVATAYNTSQGISSSGGDHPNVNGNETTAGLSNTQTNDPGNTCSPTISIARTEMQLDESCGPQCSQIRIYPRVIETQFINEFRHISFQTVIDYSDGVSVNQVGPDLGEDMATGESSYTSRANFDRPRMTLDQSGNKKIYRSVPISGVRFIAVSCVGHVIHKQ